MATIARDGAFSFEGDDLVRARVLAERLLAESALQVLEQSKRMEARLRLWSLRESCGERIPMHVRLTNGTA